MCIELDIAQRQLYTLVDTGAARSLCRKDVWLNICKGCHRNPIVQQGETLRSLSGHILPTLGRTSIEVNGFTIYVYVVEELHHDILIGGDALNILGANIDYRSHEVRLGGKRYKYRNATSKDNMLATAQTEGDRWAEQFPDVFNTDGGLKSTQLVSMDIDTGNSWPINQRPYRIPLRKRQIVEEELDKMLAEDIIERSSSSWASPITLVPKKDGTTRFCVDYRKLNAVTKKDAHPLPNIQDIFDMMTGASVFTTLDLKSGYWQIPMTQDSREKTAFVCHRGLFQFKRMPFGLTNGPAVFQRMMNHVLAPYLGKSVMVYLDDIVIFSRNPEEHEQHVAQVLEALQAAQLTVKLSKCEFGKPEVKLLGFVVSGEGITSDPEKTRAIAEMAPPRDVKGIRSFLGMCSYYRQCIPDYAKVAGPLVKLTKKYTRFVWGRDEQNAWETLRDLLISDHVMAYPQPDKPYKLYTDACDYAVGAILCQEDDNGVERPVQYISKQLSGASLNWATIEKEAWAVVFALNKLRPYLYSADFTIYTDHKPLKSLFLSEVKNTKIQRWAVLLADYGAPIEYRQGPNNIRADMLSRIKPRTDIERDSLIISAVIEEDEIPWEFDKLEKQEISREQKETPEYRLGLDDEEGYAVTDGLLYTLIPPPGKPEYPRLILPPSARFRVIRRAHAEVGHQGMRKTLDRIQEAYKWPGMRREIYLTISKCAKCAVHRSKRERVPPTAMPIAHYPSQIVGMDMCGPFPESRQGNKYILTLIDHCTGWVEVKPLANKTAANVVRYLESEYIPRYGPPEVIITDQGLEFKNRQVEGYLSSLGVDVRHSSPFHPQTNGKIERFHRTFKGILRKYVNARPGEWEEHLGPTLWAHRVSTSSVTGFTPYFLTYGRKPKLPFSRIFPGVQGYEEEVLGTRLQELTNAFREAAINTEHSRRYNHQRLVDRANAGDLNVGDTIVILANDSSPLDPKWDHGYLVVGLRGSVVTAIGPNNRRRVINREKVRLVDAEADWDILRVRQTRAGRSTKRRMHVVVKPSLPATEATGPHYVPCQPLTNNEWPRLPLQPTVNPSQEEASPHPAGEQPKLRGEAQNKVNILPATTPLADPQPSRGSQPWAVRRHLFAKRHFTVRPGVFTRSQTRQLAEGSTVVPSEEPAQGRLKRRRITAPIVPAKRLASAPSEEEASADKRRCLQFVCSFFASLQGQ